MVDGINTCRNLVDSEVHDIVSAIIAANPSLGIKSDNTRIFSTPPLPPKGSYYDTSEVNIVSMFMSNKVSGLFKIDMQRRLDFYGHNRLPVNTASTFVTRYATVELFVSFFCVPQTLHEFSIGSALVTELRHDPMILLLIVYFVLGCVTGHVIAAIVLVNDMFHSIVFNSVN